ncbi:MAG: AraC family transcriptional regulator [Ruminococcaceae bacterium]|nr:AraC family transcriptional regulator [Oscillospiraceae bacterium]
MITRYEHHLQIKTNKLEPFKLHYLINRVDSPCNWHKNIELIYITNGEGCIRYGTEQYSLCAGDLVIINSGAIHHLYSETGFDYYCLIIDDEFCEGNGIDIEKYEFEKITRDEETIRVFLEAAEMLKDQILKKKGDDRFAIPKVRSAMLSLMIELCEKHIDNAGETNKKNDRSEEHVKNALSYINENFKNSITLEDLAEHVGITKYHLSREFKKYTGETIFTYTNILRCRNAEVCILDGMKVSDAAYASGFETMSYFSGTYKKLMGIHPSKVKKHRADSERNRE